MLPPAFGGVSLTKNLLIIYILTDGQDRAIPWMLLPLGRTDSALEAGY